MNLYEVFGGNETWWLAAETPVEAAQLVSQAMGDNGYEQEDIALFTQDPEVKLVEREEAEKIPFYAVDCPEGTVLHDNMWDAFQVDVVVANAPCVVACSDG